LVPVSIGGSFEVEFLSRRSRSIKAMARARRGSWLEGNLTEILAELVALHADRIRSLRGGDPRLIVAGAEAAADAIEARVGQSSSALTAAEREALMAAQRVCFNAAADRWPGWEEASQWPAPTRAELHRGLALARRSSALVHRLDLGPLREGTSHWMIGAYHLALGETDDALAAFSLAVSRYQSAPAPGPAWLTQGYIAITYEAAGRARPDGVASFEEAQAAIAAGGFEDAGAWDKQLDVARRAFTSDGGQFRPR
jgi:hypothetical protein